MTKKNKVVLQARIKTFAWYAGMQILLLGLNFLAENAGLLEIPPFALVLIGLGASQVTKYLNS